LYYICTQFIVVLEGDINTQPRKTLLETTPERVWKLLAPLLDEVLKVSGSGAFLYNTINPNFSFTEGSHILFGLKEEDLNDLQNAFNLIHKDDYERISKAFSEFLQRGGFFFQQYKIVLANGATKTIEASVVVVDWLGNKPAHLFGIFHDITGLKLPLEIAMAGEQMALTLQDENLKFVWTDNTFDIFSSIELVGKHENELGLNPELVAFLTETKLRVLTSKESEQHSRWVEIQGQTAYVNLLLSPFTFGDGKPGVLTKTKDLTREELSKELETELRAELETQNAALSQNESRFRMALESSAITLFIQDKDLNYIWTNNVPDYWGTKDNLNGHDGEELIAALHSRELLSTIKRKVFEDKETRTITDWIYFDDGIKRFLSATFRYLDLPSGEPAIIGRIIDTTDLREAQLRADTLTTDLLETKQRMEVGIIGEPFTLYIKDSKLRYQWLYNTHPNWQGFDYIGKTDDECNLDPTIIEQVAPVSERVLLSRTPETIEVWVKGLRSDSVYLRYRIYPYTFGDNEPGIIVKVYDLTEDRKKQEVFEAQANTLASKVMELQKADVLIKDTLVQLESVNFELAQQLEALSIEHSNKMRELQEARELQINMLPSAPPTVPGVVFGAWMQTSEEVGGDYYDFLPIPDSDTMVIAIGDATGHGLRAGTMVSMVKAYFQLLATSNQPKELLQSISERIVQLNLKQMYMALTVLRYETGTRTFTYSSAGMPPLLIYRAATQHVEHLLSPSLFLGTSFQKEFDEISFSLAPLDVLIATTDGLMEARNAAGVMLGETALDATIIAQAPHGPEAIIAGLKTLQHNWQGKEMPNDDTTMLVIQGINFEY
jgi:PAS domain S-box-containing protein